MKLAGAAAPIAQGRRKQASTQIMQNALKKSSKRPSSVVNGMNQRRSSQGVKAISVLKVVDSINTTGSVANIHQSQLNDDTSVGANEYCSN